MLQEQFISLESVYGRLPWDNRWKMLMIYTGFELGLISAHFLLSTQEEDLSTCKSGISWLIERDIYIWNLKVFISSIAGMYLDLHHFPWIWQLSLLHVYTVVLLIPRCWKKQNYPLSCEISKEEIKTGLACGAIYPLCIYSS